MLRGLFTSASGLQAESLRQQVLADDLANVNTTGYKGNRSSFRVYSEQILDNLASEEEVGSLSRGTALHNVDFDFRQGPLRNTGNPLDIAVNGKGLLPVQGDNGEIHYTRNGHLNLDNNGFLVTQHGEMILDGGFSPVYIGIEGVRDITVLRNGRLSVNGNFITTLAAYDFPQGAQIKKVSGDKFKLHNSDEVNMQQVTTQMSFQQGFLENSNVSSVKAATQMIEIMRSFEANQRVIRTQQDTLDLLMDLGQI